jgi:glucose/mannose transport system substrate-binding protein
MGDSAQAAFQAAGFTFRDQFNAFPVPGTRGVFDVLVQAFALPMGAAHADSAERWVRVAASAEGERVLANALGSIPARADTVPVEYPEYQQSAISSFQHDQLVPTLAFGLAAGPEWTRNITDAIDEFGDRRIATALTAALIRAADARD